jgi:hypothetical protein
VGIGADAGGGTTVTSSEGFRDRVREQINALRLAPG